MARGNPVKIATRNFENQSKASAHFKEILNRYAPGARVADEDGLDLAALLERHPEYIQKIGCGVDHFEVRATKYGRNCFHIVRTDGSVTDFSYKHCVTGRPPSRKQEVSQAFREVIQISLFNARDAFFRQHRDSDGKVTCAVTADQISRDEAHMDHRPPMTFEVIVTTFLANRRMTPEQVPITPPRDNQIVPNITDDDLADDFRRYHTEVAKLDIVKSTVNLSQAARHRLRGGRVTLA